MEWSANKALHIVMALLLLLGSAASLPANDAGAGFDRDKWQELKRNVDYTEAPRDIDLDDELAQPPSFLWGVLIELLRYAGILALVVGLVVLIIKLTGGVRFRKKSRAHSPELIATEASASSSSLDELQEALKAALANKDYKEAIRLHYQLIIKHLLLAEVVTEAPDKTNWEYATEIKNQSLSGQFAKLTAFFEYIWFGNGPANERTFQAGRLQFEQFIQNIPREKAQ